MTHTIIICQTCSGRGCTSCNPFGWVWDDGVVPSKCPAALAYNKLPCTRMVREDGECSRCHEQVLRNFLTFARDLAKILQPEAL
jgi:hypothetical protein